MTFTPKKVLFSTGTIATGYFWAVSNGYFRIQDISIDQNDNIYIGGQIGSNSQRKPYFGQYDTDLNINWGRYRNSYGDRSTVNVIRTAVDDVGSSTDDVWVQGLEANSNGSTTGYPTLSRFDASGTQNFDKRYNLGDYIASMDIHPTENVIAMVGNNGSTGVSYTTNHTGGNVYRNTDQYRKVAQTACTITKRQGVSPRAIYGANRDDTSQNFSFGKVWSIGQGNGSHVSGAIGELEQLTIDPTGGGSYGQNLYGWGRESGEHMCIFVWTTWINSGDSNTLNFARGYRFDSESSPYAEDCMYVENEAGLGTDYVYAAFSTANSAWVMKHSTSGGLIWARKFRGTNAKIEGISLASDSAGDVWVAGHGTFNGSSNRGFVAKIPPNGDYTGTYGDLTYDTYSSLSQKTGISRQSNSGGCDFSFAGYSASSANTSLTSTSSTFTQEDGFK